MPRWRFFVAVYLDFILFSVLWGYVEHLWKPQIAYKFVVFTIIELLVHKIIDWSPGKWLMRAPYQHGFVVAVGVFIMLEGSKTMIRWSMWTPPAPFFGSMISAGAWPMFAIAHGIIECLIAYLFLRGHVASGPLAFAYFGTSVASAAASWNLWDPWVAEATVRRRAYQGLPLREGEIARMQSMTPEIVIGGMVFFLLLSLIAWIVILKQRRASTSVPEYLGTSA
jgi:hypothetical protein